MTYGYLGSMKTHPGQRDSVIEILLAGVDSLRDVGCSAYVVSTSAADADIIWVFEMWTTKGHHDASLELPETKESIRRAMPMLTGEFTGWELDVVGGIGA